MPERWADAHARDEATDVGLAAATPHARAWAEDAHVEEAEVAETVQTAEQQAQEGATAAPEEMAVEEEAHDVAEPAPNNGELLK